MLHVMNCIGDVNQVIALRRNVQVFAFRDPAFELNTEFLADPQGGLHHPGRNVNGSDLRSLQSEIDRRFAKPRPDIQKLFPAQRAHSAQNELVFDCRGSLEALADQNVVNLCAAGPRIVELGFAARQRLGHHFLPRSHQRAAALG